MQHALLYMYVYTLVAYNFLSSGPFSFFLKERYNDPGLEGKGEEFITSSAAWCITNNTGVTDKMKELAQRWKTLSDTSKQVSAILLLWSQ